MLAMRCVLLFFGLLFCVVPTVAQSNCPNLTEDTLFLPKESKAIAAEYMQANLKNGGNLRLYKTRTNKLYLRLVVTENLYFDKVDLLELQSGSKSFYAKDTKQVGVDKSSGAFVVEIYKNYVYTLREDGLSRLVFGKTETSFGRGDGSQVRQLAKCFYETIDTKK